MLEIRKMEANEALEVAKVAKKSFSIVEKFFIGKPKEAVVAALDGKIVGGIIVKYITSGTNKIGYYDGAFIDPDYQGQGIGSKLYKGTADYLWGEGCTAQGAFVKDDNVASWKLFLNNGFSRASFLEGVKILGLKTMIKYYFTTPFFISNGMEFYLSVKNAEVKAKEVNTSKNIFMYLLINALLLLPALIESTKNYPMYLAAYITLLTSGIFFSYIGTLFSKRKWNFRVNSGGGALVAFMNLLGSFYPMIGNWYPDKYENTKEFKKDMGVVSFIDWIGLICITITTFFYIDNSIFSKYLLEFCLILLCYRIIVVYPFEGYGGGRVYSWSKKIYGLISLISGALILLLMNLK